MLVPLPSAVALEDGSAVADPFVTELFQNILFYVGLIPSNGSLAVGMSPYRLGSVLDDLYDEGAMRRGLLTLLVEKATLAPL